MWCRPRYFDRLLSLGRRVGLIVLAIGALLVILFVPWRFWLGILGFALVALGFVLWRCL